MSKWGGGFVHTLSDLSDQFIRGRGRGVSYKKRIELNILKRLAKKMGVLTRVSETSLLVLNLSYTSYKHLSKTNKTLN